MPKIDESIDVAAAPETVWAVLSDRENEFKFYPSLVWHQIDPPGLAVLGQKAHSIGRVGGVKVETFTEIVEIEPNTKLVFQLKRGRILKLMVQTITLEATPRGTTVRDQAEFDVSLGYLGQALRALVLDRAIRKNFSVFLKSLKELAESKQAPHAL
jgi:carbon monoxide dehydrogenase subunit G